MLDYAHHWTTRGATAKQVIVEAFYNLEWDEEAEAETETDNVTADDPEE
jgi:hypothetical protein